MERVKKGRISLNVGKVMKQNLRMGLILVLSIGCLMCSGCTGPAVLTGEPDADTIPDGSPSPTVPEGRITPLFFTSLHKMQSILDPEITLALPYYLPNGYLFSGGAWPPGSETGWREVCYQRGEETLVLFQQPLNQGSFDSGTDGDIVDATVGGESALLIIGEKTEVQWSRYNLSFRLTGPLPQDVMIDIAESVRPAPYDPGTPPPYDYVPPENPLEETFAIEQVISANNLTVTFVSLECTREWCEAVFFVDLVASPAAPAPPGGTTPPRSPDPHGEFWVDDSTPLRTTQSYSYRPEGNGTLIFWRTDPIPSDAGVFHARITKFRNQEGLWEFSVNLHRVYPEDAGRPFFDDWESISNTASFLIRTHDPLTEEQIETLRRSGVRKLAPSEIDMIYHSLIEEDQVERVRELEWVEDVYPNKLKDQA
jgi:hypothetical protein